MARKSKEVEKEVREEEVLDSASEDGQDDQQDENQEVESSEEDLKEDEENGEEEDEDEDDDEDLVEDGDENVDSGEEGEEDGAKTERKSIIKPTEAVLRALEAREDGSKRKRQRRGVVYIAHPPAFMKPVKVRHLLSQYGEVTNLYLVPEDVGARKRRTRGGGSSKIKYTEGWIEFADRKIAKAVANSLNNVPVGGHRRNFHHDTLWMLKYLPGFEWSHLTEKQAYERRTKKARLRAELAHAKRQNERYVEKVAIERHIQHKSKAGEEDHDAGDSGDDRRAKKPKREAKRSFKQLESRDEYKAKKEGRQDKAPAFLGNIFT